MEAPYYLSPDIEALSQEPIGGLMGWHELCVVRKQIEDGVGYNYAHLSESLAQHLGYAKKQLATAEATAAELKQELADQEAEKLVLVKENQKLANLGVFYPADDWHDELSDVLWWRFPIVEPPYVGSPLDTDWDYDAGYTHFQKWDYRHYDEKKAPACSGKCPTCEKTEPAAVNPYHIPSAKQAREIAHHVGYGSASPLQGKKGGVGDV